MLEDILRVNFKEFRGNWIKHCRLVEFLYNNSYHAYIRSTPYEVLNGRPCRSPIFWVEYKDFIMMKNDLIQETTKKICIHKTNFLQLKVDTKVMPIMDAGL